MGGSDPETVAFGNITDRRSRRATESQTKSMINPSVRTLNRANEKSRGRSLSPVNRNAGQIDGKSLSKNLQPSEWELCPSESKCRREPQRRMPTGVERRGLTGAARKRSSLQGLVIWKVSGVKLEAGCFFRTPRHHFKRSVEYAEKLVRSYYLGVNT